MKDTRKWLSEYFGATSVREAAKAIGMKDHKKLYRWVDTEYAPWVVIALSRHYNRGPVERLYATGLLTEEEARAGDVTGALKAASDMQLSEEIVARVREGGGFHATLTEPIQVPDVDVQISDEGLDISPPEDTAPDLHRTSLEERGR